MSKCHSRVDNTSFLGGRMRTFQTCLFVGLLLTASVSLGASVITVPTDLNVGDSYRLLFVTSTKSEATSTSIATYNSFVNSVADTVPELADIDWYAVGSTSSVDARDNTGTNPNDNGPGFPVYLLDGVRIAADNADLWDGTLPANPQITELRTLMFNRTFTGSTASGVKDTYVLGYGAGLNDPIRTGDPRFSDSQWMLAGVQGAGQPAPFYALSEILTKVPEPASFSILVLGVLVLAVGRRRP